MKKNVYSPEVRHELICRYQQSGLSPNKFCKLPNVPISSPTLREWLRRYGGSSHEVVQSPTAKDITIACYAVRVSLKLSTDSQEKCYHYIVN